MPVHCARGCLSADCVVGFQSGFSCTVKSQMFLDFIGYVCCRVVFVFVVCSICGCVLHSCCFVALGLHLIPLRRAMSWRFFSLYPLCAFLMDCSFHSKKKIKIKKFTVEM